MSTFSLEDFLKRNEDKNKVEKGCLYLVATPIGNLMDITLRALKILSEVDFIAAEDTRNSGKLLSLYGIDKPFVSYFEHNKKERGPYICRRLEEGESCALVTDAGMPAVSDPGEDLVVLCREKGIPVHCVPGACAAVTALALSSLPTDKFCFEGFLPAAKKARADRLETLKSEERTVIFYEAPHRLRDTLESMAQVLGDREISLCRELTKLNEEITFSTVQSALEEYDGREPRGEYVLVMRGACREELDADAFWRDMTVTEHVEYYLHTMNMEKKTDAVKAAARDRGVPKGVLYRQLLEESPEQ